MATEKKKKDIGTILIALSVIISISIILVVSAVLFQRGEKVTSNPPGTTGNTAGNLNNGGIVCESDVATSSNVTGNYIYYFQSGSSGAAGLGSVRIPHAFIRSHIDGSKGYTISRDVVVKAQVIGDRLYLEGTAD